MPPAACLPAPLHWGCLAADDAWQALDCVSDLHLHADDPATWALFQRWLRHTDADAIVILGDLFEVWLGDDCLQAEGCEHDWQREVCAALQAASRQRPLYLLHGNRDFLLGPAFACSAGTQMLPDPTLLQWAGRGWLLSHGDAWCLADTDYQRFRQQVRSADWQAGFLQRPLPERQALARALRRDSQAHQQQLQASGQAWADVDSDTALQWLQATGAQVLVHGHTHHPADHALPGAHQRLVLSDWDAQARPPRAEVLRLQPQGHWQRLPLQP